MSHIPIRRKKVYIIDRNALQDFCYLVDLSLNTAVLGSGFNLAFSLFLAFKMKLFGKLINAAFPKFEGFFFRCLRGGLR